MQGVLDLLATQAVRILDFPHAGEHLGTIATLVAGAGTPAATAWAADQRVAVAQGPLCLRPARAPRPAPVPPPRLGSVGRRPGRSTPRSWPFCARIVAG